MSEVVVSSSSYRIDKAIDEYHNTTSYSSSSSGSSTSSSKGNTTDEEYASSIPGVLLKVFQEQLRTRATYGSQAGTSTSVPPTPLDEIETMYGYAIGIPSKTNERGLAALRSWYQIPNDLNPRLAVQGEWCCNPHFGIGVYKAYLLEGLRLPLNAFASELLTRLGLGVCQFNPNAWRLVVFMQVLWREVFEGDRPLIVDEFLFYFKPSKINQSPGFNQLIAKGKDYRLIKSLVTSNRN